MFPGADSGSARVDNGFQQIGLRSGWMRAWRPGPPHALALLGAAPREGPGPRGAWGLSRQVVRADPGSLISRFSQVFPCHHALPCLLAFTEPRLFVSGYMFNMPETAESCSAHISHLRSWQPPPSSCSRQNPQSPPGHFHFHATCSTRMQFPSALSSV